MKIFSLVSFVAILNHLSPSLAKINYQCELAIIDGDAVRGCVDYFYPFALEQIEASEDRDALFSYGHFMNLFKSKLELDIHYPRKFTMLELYMVVNRLIVRKQPQNLCILMDPLHLVSGNARDAKSDGSNMAGLNEVAKCV
ncbi:CSEP0487 putative effector protein [Blumeria hordei DH14]|uniref:CSEP0487 putative effector protein n=1 Tax=Blumeria graminis f. sp. hordei (strain DH14) TaxID=546991 RepID=N1JRE9_BLUG1|nr:CSEP0487 putative effector protein [Blumeria hordei DH14]